MEERLFLEVFDIYIYIEVTTHELVRDLPAVGHGDLRADLLGDGLAVPAAAVAGLAGLAARGVAALALVDVLGVALLLVLGGAPLLVDRLALGLVLGVALLLLRRGALRVEGLLADLTKGEELLPCSTFGTVPFTWSLTVSHCSSSTSWQTSSLTVWHCCSVTV